MADNTLTAANVARIITGTIVSFSGDPRCLPIDKVLDHIPDGALVLGNNGRILWRGPIAALPDNLDSCHRTDYPGCFIMPGFIDLHVHFPQYRIPAAPGKDLLDWLERYTFPEEMKYGDHGHAEHAAHLFLQELFRNGTTSALAFATSHVESVNALFAAAEAHNMALITGKTMMNRMAPDGLTDEATQSYEDSQKLIDTWHGKKRLGYAVTPRFAITSTDSQLRYAGALLADNPDVLMQTHLSESLGEISTVEDLFPNACDYTHVYEQFGLLTDRSIFAHGVHLSESEFERIHNAGAAIIHCPTSNNFLGSGLFDMPAALKTGRPIHVGLATDIGGGTSYSMPATMGEAYKVAILKGYTLNAYEAFYMATLGNADIVNLSAEIGSLDVNKYADIAVINPCATPLLAMRQDISDTLEQSLFACMILGDDRLIQATYVAGQPVYGAAKQS